MPSPTKPHFVVDAAFYSSKEVAAIPRRYRMAAIGAWTAAGSWSVDHLTDGWVPVSVLVDLGVTAAQAEALMTATLWTVGDVRDGHATDAWTLRDRRVTAVQFTNWGRWQKTKAEWTAGRESSAERARNYRRSKKGSKEGSVTRDATVTHLRAVNGPDSTVTRDASHRREEKRSELSRELSAVGSDAAPPPPISFPDHCTRHRHDPEPPPCNDCRRVREQNHAADTASAASAADADAARKARAAQRRRDCWDCDDYGQIEVFDPATGESRGVRNCDHPDVP